MGVVNGTQLLRIWDPALVSGLPDDDVGKITISGTLHANGGELRVLVAGVSDAWPAEPEDALTATGLRNLGLNSGDGVEISDSALRQRTRLAAFTSRDINGTIQVGQVQRVQAGNAEPSTLTGLIAANITAVSLDSEFGQGIFRTPTIGHVAAGNGITGTLTAQGAGTFDATDANTYASVGKVVVGPSTSSSVVGLQGDIRADTGKIGVVYSSGPIGSATVQPKVWAANGIQQVRTVSEDPITGFQSVSFQSINADIRANLDYPEAGVYVNEGVIEFVEAGGMIDGQIRAGNLNANGNVGMFGGFSGIVAYGPIKAPITVDHQATFINIMGSSIQGDIIIGRHLKGAIVAYGTNTAFDAQAGKITGLVQIGRTDETESYNGAARGQVGVDSGIVQMVPRAALSLPGSIVEPNAAVWLTQSTGGDVGAIDALIRAETSIGAIDIVAMTHFWGTGPSKDSRPRIEAPRIGSLTIDEMGTGVVWSGKLEYLRDSEGEIVFDEINEPVLANDPSNDFAILDAVSIGCVSPEVDMWFTECPLFDVTGDMLGELHVPSLDASEIIRIGGRLGKVDSSRCGCVNPADPSSNCYPGDISNLWNEPSPRGIPSWNEEASDGVALTSSILVRESDSLAGQIIIDALNSTGTRRSSTHWAGSIRIGEPRTVWLSPSQSQPDQAPLYDRSTVPTLTVPGLGGGAVGLVPFAVHNTDCSPAPTSTGPGTAVFSGFFGSSPIRVVFYGPIKDKTPTAALSPVKVELAISLTGPFIDMSDHFAATFVGRELRLAPSAAHSAQINFPHGTFRVSSRDNRVICGELPTGVIAPVAFNFFFKLEPSCGTDLTPRPGSSADCNNNDIMDICDIVSGLLADTDPADGIPDSCPATDCAADFNHDDALNPDDLADYIGCYFTVPPCAAGDFNADSNIDPDDLADYIGAYFSGC